MSMRLTHPGRPAAPARYALGLFARPSVRDGLGVLGGLAPLGIALGAAIAASGVPAPIGLLTSPLLYGASLQLTAIALLGTGASMAAVIFSVAIVNGRSVFYSAALQTRLGPQPRWFRWSGPYLLVDPLFALAGRRADQGSGGDDLRTYYLGAGITIWIGWQLLVATGAFAGPAVPAQLSIEFAVPALLTGLLVPGLRCRTAVVAAGAGFLIAIAATGLPSGTGLLLAGAGGAVVVSIRESKRC